MKRCKDCRFFGDPVLDDWDVENPGKQTGYHVCGYIEHINESRVWKWKQANAGVMDGSGYYAALVVKDDFGCVNFSEKSA